MVGQPVALDSSGRDLHPASPGELGAEGSLLTPAPVPRTRGDLGPPPEGAERRQDNPGGRVGTGGAG